MEKKSCLMRLGIGCGGLLALFVLTGAIISATVMMGKPAEKEIKISTHDDAIPGFNLEQNQSPFSESQAKQMKPLKLKINARFVNLTVKRGDQAEGIRIESNYDHANYTLTTNMEETDQSLNYSIDFDSKRNTLALIYNLIQSGDENVNNELTILLPANYPLTIEHEGRYLEADYNLSGLAVTELSGNNSMGAVHFSCNEPNAVPMESIHFQYKTGETEFSGFQNFNAKKVWLKGSMGEMTIASSGPLQRDTEMHLEQSMGELRIYLPTETNIDSSDFTIAMAEKQSREDTQHDPNRPTLKITGSLRMGDVNMIRPGSARWLMDEAYSLIRAGDLDGTLAKIRKAKEEEPNRVEPSTLNTLGYRLLGRDKFEEAIGVFSLNIELHPNYANGYDSLGEAYYKSENLEKALELYEEALKRDPEFDSSAEMVSRIKKELGIVEEPKTETDVEDEKPSNTIKVKTSSKEEN